MKPHRNRGLFSNYYLDDLLPKEEEFKVPIAEIEDVLKKIKGIWDKSRFEAINENQLRKHFLDKVLDYLGWIVDIDAPVPSGEWSKRPDYALFKDNENLKIAHKGKKEDYFKKAACIGEAKKWGRPLDKKIKTEIDPFEAQNPSLQISRYLWLTGVKWGILTDGKYWRLYERETSKRLDIFYEVDLEDIIESGSPEVFRYFFLFFRKDAFPEFIEKVYRGSVDYAQAVGEKLKENVYQALKTLAQGFLKTPGNNLSEANLKEIHDNSLIFLYRLLFILYAEYRDLLPLGSNKLYTESYSLDAFKKEVANRLDRNEPVATSTVGYWNRLKELFEIIDKGNEELDVPPYNGGLFESEKHDFLEKYRVGDLYIAKAVDFLSRSKDRAYIDYGSLEIRHLGSIYEGLLEYKLRIAEEDLIPVKDKGKERFVSLEEAKKQKKIREDEIVQTGEMYPVTDKGERKATGSYYTPDYIVKYIVENTLGPLVEEKRKMVSEKVEELIGKIKVSRGLNRELLEKELKKVEGSFIDEILSLKVLDPAMGSGHFLVEATDFLARELLKVLSGEPLVEHAKEMVISETLQPYGLKEPEEEDIRWARREVVEKCIFGVDLNPMAVELAKLSLWLYTVAKNRPLNFLDHHFRCGNSLIGAKIADLAGLPELKKKKTVEGQPVQLGLFESVFKEKVNLLLGAFSQIESLPSDTVEQIRKKEKLYQDFRKIVSRFQDVADVWTSRYFGNKVNFGNCQSLQDNLRSSEDEWKELSQEPWFKKAKDIVDEKRFLHWELEFPEVFFEGHKRKENPGFDCVIGNPPYIQLAMDKVLATELRPFLLSRYQSSMGRLNTFGFFAKLGIECMRHHGFLSFIVPNTMLTMPYYIALRSFVLDNTLIRRLLLLDALPFDEAIVENIVFVIQKESASSEREHNEVCIDRPQVFTVQGGTQKTIQQSVFMQSKGNVFGVYIDTALTKLQEKIQAISNRLDILVHINQAIALKHDRAAYIYDRPHGQEYKELVDGRDIDRYLLDFHNTYLKYDLSAIHSCKREDIFLTQEKLLFRRVGASLVVCYDDKQHYALNTLVVINAKRKKVNLKFLLTLLNSRLLNWYFFTFLKSTKEVFSEIQARQMAELPIPRISFVTPEVKTKRLVEEAKNYYKTYLEAGKPDTILYFIESRLMKEYRPDPELVKKHNADHLNKDFQIPEGALWEQSDVVHNILAFLAEQMIEMNKEKQSEIKGFLGWLESQLKIEPDTKGNKGIDALVGKSQIKNYPGDYQKGEGHLSFEDFWKILEKNKGRIQANLKSRELYENIKSEFEKSLSKLLPLKEKLRQTDWLIDKIVYKLYGLTEEEIKIVEGHS